MNNRGQAVGSYARTATSIPTFLWEDGQFTELPFPGAQYAAAFGINDSGQIVGEYQTGNHVSGFLLDRGEVTLIEAPGAAGTYAHGINNRGDIVGSYFDGNGVLHGFLARPKHGSWEPVP